MIWIISDTHFGHALCARLRGFGADVQAHDDALIDAWNKRVAHRDVVYHLGDFTMQKNPQRYLDKLNGRLNLIAGNHDSKMSQCNSRWESVNDVVWLKYEKTYIMMCHYPMQTWRSSHYGSLHLHGHCHGRLPPIGRRQDVGVDCTGLAPMSLDHIAQHLLTKPIFDSDNRGSYE